MFETSYIVWQTSGMEIVVDVSPIYAITLLKVFPNCKIRHFCARDYECVHFSYKSRIKTGSQTLRIYSSRLWSSVINSIVYAIG